MKPTCNLSLPISAAAETTSRSARLILMLLCTLLTGLFFTAPGFTAEQNVPPGKIIFLPFTVQTKPQQQYLQNGLTDILATRLSSRTGLAVVHKTSETQQLTTLMRQGDQEAFKKTLEKLHADYLVIGSLEQRDSDYEIMVHVFNRFKGTPASFTKSIPKLDRIIPTMDEISIEIADQVFNKNIPEQLVSPLPEEKGISGFQTAHPDRAYREGLYRPAAILGLDGDSYQILSSRRSNKIETAVRAMDVGDLDGDGINEIVLVEHGNLAIYRFSADHFQHISDQELPGYLAPHAVRLADLNSNGRLEIYITANNGDKPASQVFEWDGRQFHTLFNDVPYYLRPGLDMEGKPVLLGQTNSQTGPAGKNFYILEETGSATLKPTAKLPVPKGFNLMDFVRADLDQDGQLEFIGITTKNRLVIMNPANTVLWTSEAGYGASKDFLGTLSSNRDAGRTPVYMHTRIAVKDENGDGKPEIIVGRNRLTNVKYFERLRYFEGSSISALNWNGSEISTLWETRKISGYTCDYQVVDSTSQHNSSRLYFVESDNSYPLFFWESENSIIHLYEMGQKTKKTAGDNTLN